MFEYLDYNVPRSANEQSKIYRLDCWKDFYNFKLDVLIDPQNTKMVLKDETTNQIKNSRFLFNHCILYVRSTYLDCKIKHYDRNKRKLKNIITNR